MSCHGMFPVVVILTLAVVVTSPVNADNRPHYYPLEAVTKHFKGMSWRVQFQMNIDNNSSKPLRHIATDTVSGSIDVLEPPTVDRYQAEGMTGRKTSYAATGVAGTVTYQIGGDDKCLLPSLAGDDCHFFTVMYSLPYSFDFYSNWLAVAIHEQHRPTSKRMFDVMYYEDQNNNLFARNEYYSSIKETVYRRKGFQVTGIMGSSHATTITITLNEINSE